MSNSADDPSHPSGNYHGIVFAVVVVVIIIIISVASYVCSRAFCSVQYHCCEPSSHDNNPLRGRSSDHLQLAEEGRINREGSRRKGNQDTSRSCCSICLADYRKDDELRSLPDCNHLFHRECIDPWLRLHPTCPICRKSPIPTPKSTPLVFPEAEPFRAAIGTQ